MRASLTMSAPGKTRRTIESALHPPEVGHKADRLLSHHHLRRFNTDMDDIRDSLSKMKKKFKHRLTGRKRKPDGTGANPGGEGADSTSSLPQPEPHVVAGESHKREGDRDNTAGERAFSTDRSQPDGPESVSVRRSDDDQEGGEADADEGEAGHRHSHPRPDVEVMVGSGRSEGLEELYPSPSTPSISRAGELDST